MTLEGMVFFLIFCHLELYKRLISDCEMRHHMTKFHAGAGCVVHGALSRPCGAPSKRRALDKGPAGPYLRPALRITIQQVIIAGLGIRKPLEVIRLWIRIQEFLKSIPQHCKIGHFFRIPNYGIIFANCCCLYTASSMRPEAGQRCPFRGQYLSQPDSSGCQLSIRSSCRQIDHIDVVSTCLKKPSTYHHFLPAAILINFHEASYMRSTEKKLESVQLRRHCNSKAIPTSRQSIWHISVSYTHLTLPTIYSV